MTNADVLLEFDDAALGGGRTYPASLSLLDHAPYRLDVVGLTLKSSYPEDDSETVTVLLDETRARALIDALAVHFGITAVRPGTDDARDEALAEKTDAHLGH